jgi:hypothetical protein
LAAELGRQTLENGPVELKQNNHRKVLDDLKRKTVIFTLLYLNKYLLFSFFIKGCKFFPVDYLKKKIEHRTRNSLRSNLAF